MIVNLLVNFEKCSSRREKRAEAAFFNGRLGIFIYLFWFLVPLIDQQRNCGLSAFEKKFSASRVSVKGISKSIRLRLTSWLAGVSETITSWASWLDKQLENDWLLNLHKTALI